MNTILHLIDQWNSSRLELFKISHPDKNLKFYGVMRFFFETDDKFHSKCLRVSSEMKVKDLLPILREKFYVSNICSKENDFKLFERSSSIDKLLNPDDFPLLIQLLWCKDDKEGVFVLKNNSKDTKMSRRPRSENRKDKIGSTTCLNSHSNRCLDKVCTDPHSKTKPISKSPSLISTPSFLSRTISNHESLMRLKRKSKLEEKLKQISKSGNLNAGGTLKIYGDSLNPSIPYKSLLLSIDDTAEFVVREILDKYGMDNVKENDFCLVCSTFKEQNSQKIEFDEILQNSDSPLKFLLQSNSNSGFVRFRVIRKPPNIIRPKKNKVSNPPLDICKDVSINKSNIKKSNSISYQKPDVQCYSRDIFDGKSFHSYPTDFINETNNNGSTNKIYSTPPSSDSPLLLMKINESEKKPLPSYEESVSALRNWRYKISKLPEETKQISNKGSMDSFSLSSDYQDNSSYNTDSCESHNLPSVETNDRENEDVVIISDLDSHLSRHLPVQITYFKSKEDMLLDSILLDIKPSQTKFKLASAYVLHLMVVDIIRLTCINRATVVDQELVISMFIDKVASKIRQSIMQHRTIISIQSYWLANCTEFLHLLKNNILLSQFNSTYFDKYYDLFADNAQWCFQCISFGFTDDMVNTLSVLLSENSDDPDDKDDYPLSRKATDPKNMSDLMRTLSSCMTVLQQCHVNAALIIQIISRIFHLINCWIFNCFIDTPSRISRVFARAIMNRIERIRRWSERHDLLLAADCYFQQSIQTCKLLIMEKTDIEILYNESVDMVDINSIQLRYLLENYVYCPNEPRVPQIWIDFVVSGANQVADKVFEEEGIEISLKEKESLNLPLLLPEDGYHVDSLYGGVPVGFIEYLEKLHKEWCFYKISHQDIHFDWLCHKKTYQEQNSNEILVPNKLINEQNIVVKKEDNNKSYSSSRHQLKLSDFKANIYYENLDNVNNNESIGESGIDTYRNQSSSHSVSQSEVDYNKFAKDKQYSQRSNNSNRNNNSPFDFNYNLYNSNFPKQFSDAGSTTAASFVSEMIDDDDPCNTHSKRLKVIQNLRKSLETNMEQRVVAQEQFQSIIDEADEIYSKKLNRQLNQLDKDKSEELYRINYQQFNLMKSSNLSLEKSENQRKTEFIIQSERMKNICELESQMESIDKYSLLQSSTLPIRNSLANSQPPVSFVPASLALRNSLNYPPRLRPKPKNNSLSIGSRSHSAANISKSDSSFEISSRIQPRSLSNDRFYSRMSEGMENLSFQEKVQLFEFAISRSSH